MPQFKIKTILIQEQKMKKTFIPTYSKKLPTKPIMSNLIISKYLKGNSQTEIIGKKEKTYSIFFSYLQQHHNFLVNHRAKVQQLFKIHKHFDYVFFNRYEYPYFKNKNN